MEKIIYGGDTETVGGKPNSLQFYSEDIACNDIIFCNEKNARKKFLAWCAKRKPNIQHVIYFHNLDFDLPELFWGCHEKLIENGGEFQFSADGFDIRGVYGTPTVCTLRKGSTIHIVIADSFSFYRGSLAQAATLYCPELPKLRRPVDLGQRRYTAASTAFVEYAMRDAQISFYIGKSVEELHREFDLKQCVSVAHLAASIFRRRYLTYTIPQPSTDVVYAALDSYHGGKNNITVGAGWYPKTYGIDISSAYVHSMSEMPAFSDASLYKKYRAAKRVQRVPRYGVYCVTGIAADCSWPSLFDHAFKPLRGDFAKVWIQGFDLNAALEAGEVKIRRIEGHYYDEDKDHQAPALRAFCEDFYHRKQTEKDKVKRYGYKTIGNSVYGKFIQTRKRTLKCYVDIDSEEVTTASELVAGGMFHSFIASGICAHTRGRIHGLEHEYKAIHTATDGIFTRTIPKRNVTRGQATRLGELVCDSYGELLLIRNKCYIMYGDENDDSFPSKAFEGKHIQKFAKHGFQGSVYDLERLVATGERKYTVNKPNRLKESLAGGLVPNEFRERPMTLRIGPIGVKE